MARSRYCVFLCVVLLIASPPFFSERPTPIPRAPPDSLGPSQHWARQEPVQQLLLSPTLAIHALWIIALPVLSVPAEADVFLRLVFICCTVGVELITRFVFVPYLCYLKCNPFCVFRTPTQSRTVQFGLLPSMSHNPR